MTKKIGKEFLLQTLQLENVDISKPSDKIIDKNLLLDILSGKEEANGYLKEFRPKGRYKVELVKNITLNTNIYYKSGLSSIPTPLYLFGLTDYFGGLYNFLSINNVKQVYDGNFTSGVIGFNGFSFVGFDQGSFFTDFISLKNAFRRQVNISTGSNYTYGMMQANLMDDVYIIDSLQIYITDGTVDCFDIPLRLSKVDIFGKILTETISLRTFVTPESFQTKIITVPLNIVLDKNLIISHAATATTNSIQYNFKLLKIK